MANFNKVLLMGNLTRDPQLSYLPSQTAVVEFGLAVNRKWKGQDGNQREETCFVDCKAFGRQAENINKYLSKGRGVFVEGRLTFDSWTAQDGTKRSRHRVTVENSQFLPGGARAGADQAGPSYDQTDSQIKDTGTGVAKGEPEQQANADDIPF
ncbi:MAG: single-stranded DNA-binding protein [Planctomycetota bacterium]|jgi:single-strand DNA-binding protein